MGEIEIDNRGLMPPEPMVRILSAIAEAEPGGTVVALMDREPLLLYPELERRDCTWTFEEDEDHFKLTVRVSSS
jgi:RecB family exonuclease